MNSEEHAPPRPLLNRNRKFPLPCATESSATRQRRRRNRCWHPAASLSGIHPCDDREVGLSGRGITDEGADDGSCLRFETDTEEIFTSSRWSAKSRAPTRTSEERAGPGTSMEPENAEMRRDRQTTFINRPRDGRGSFPEGEREMSHLNVSSVNKHKICEYMPAESGPAPA